MTSILSKAICTLGFIFVGCVYGQIRIVNSTVNAAALNSSAFIDASSDTAVNHPLNPNMGKGLLFPQTDLTRFTSFGGVSGNGNNPPPGNYPTRYDGMIVYNTANSGVAGVGSTEGTLSPGYWYYDNPTTTLNGGTWRPWCDCCSTPEFEIINCDTTIGYLGKGLPANSADIAAKQTIQVNVTNPGPYNFTTGGVNGVTFSASGIFTSPGVQSVTLVASGIPNDYTVGNNTINYTVNNTTGTNAGNCSFGRKVYLPDQNYTGAVRNTNGRHRFLYKVITGPGNRDWLQTNLGAHYNQVGHPSFDPEKAAVNVDDYMAFGSLFQGGKNSDGHELMDWASATTGTPVYGTTTSCGLDTGLFYTAFTPTSPSCTVTTISEIRPNGGGGSYNVVGPGRPCPQGFVIAKYSTEWPDNPNVGKEEGYYPDNTFNAGSSYWVNHPLKLVAPMVYRNAENGNLTPMSSRMLRTNWRAPLGGGLPQFVIEGFKKNVQNHDFPTDRRIYQVSTSDGRGWLDGYPIRCVKEGLGTQKGVGIQ